MRPFPFSALVGQDELRLALLLNAVAPEVGGVLVRGEKGTAKSTAVRALATLLPPIEVVRGCRFACDPHRPNPDCPDGPHPDDAPVERREAPLVELPVGASVDRLVGSIDVERALATGEVDFEPGLIARAHRGVLYVDEVNLLGDHLVDALLDVAASGWNVVEREGVGVRHPSAFVLVGTMNPEEGELRPQLLDRFGLACEVRGTDALDERTEIVRRRLAYEADPEGFAARWATDEATISARITAAKRLLLDVELGDVLLERIAGLCVAFGVDGLRADIVTAKAARTLAAWEGRTEVTLDDVRRAAALALPHRRRRGPLDEPSVDLTELDEALDSGDPPPSGEPPAPGEPPDDDPPPGGGGGRGPGEQDGDGRDSVEAPTAPFTPTRIEVPGRGRGPAGRRSPAEGATGHLRDARSQVTGELAVAATLRAAAPYQRRRGRRSGGLRLRPTDLRWATHVGREANLVLLCVDASGSMAARRRIAAAKGAALSLLLDAYRRRDRVGMIVFGREVRCVLEPTRSIDVAARQLEGLPAGGPTPLGAGLTQACRVLDVARLREPDVRPLVVVVTDGRPTAGDPDPITAALTAGAALRERSAALVIDTEEGRVRIGIAHELGAAMGADVVRLSELEAEPLSAVVRREIA